MKFWKHALTTHIPDGDIAHFQVQAGAARTCRYTSFDPVASIVLRGDPADLLVRAGGGQRRRALPALRALFSMTPQGFVGQSSSKWAQV